MPIAALGAFFILRGYAAGAPGALQMFNVYVVWPLVYTVLVAGASSPGVLRGLVRVLVLAANAVAAYSVIYVLWSAGLWPDSLYYAFDQGQAIGFYPSHIEFNLYSISTLLFLVPFVISALIVFPDPDEPVRRRTLWLSARRHPPDGAADGTPRPAGARAARADHRPGVAGRGCRPRRSGRAVGSSGTRSGAPWPSARSS